MRAIDTNILVRIATQDDERQARSAERAVAEGAWVSQVVLAETAWVLVSLYGLSRAELGDVIGRLLDHVSIAVQDQDLVAEALALFNRSNKISFPDCLILEIARKAGHTPLVTFDREFAKLDGVERITASA